MMANTYSQINIHAVFSVKARDCILMDTFRNRTFEYIAGLLRSRECYPLIVGGYYDHVHLFFELPLNISIADIVRDIKRETSEWINQQRFIHGRFSWQEGYGAFSYSKSHRDAIIKYISNQHEHHRTTTFSEEYRDFLTKFGIPFDKQYIFKPIDLSNENN